jgi:hypothetical protein
VKAKMLVQDHVLFKFIVTVIITINEFWWISVQTVILENSNDHLALVILWPPLGIGNYRLWNPAV